MAIGKFLEDIKPYIIDDDVRTIYDIGAGSCEETLELKSHFKNANVYAFECNPVCIANCSNNIVNKNGIFLIPICVFNITGFIKFHPINQQKTKTTHPDGNPRASSVFVSNGTYALEEYVQDEINIPCMSMRDIIEIFDISTPDIVWMDLQGAELQALEGFWPYLHKTTKIIHTEVTNKAMYSGQSLWPDIKSHLEKIGFVCITPASIIHEDFVWADVDFVRKEIYDSAERQRKTKEVH